MLENYDDINSMSGVEFEFLCKELLEKMGFETETTKASGDGGIDLIAYNYQPILSGKYIIQCKRYVGSVGEPVIRDLYGVITSERANKGILMTTGHFTKSAIEFAMGKPIELIDGSKLNELLSLYELDNINTLESDEETSDIEKSHCWIINSQQYINLKEAIKKDPLDWNCLQEIIHILMQALTSSIILNNYIPTKSEYNEIIDECMFYLSRISMYESPLCKYTVTYCKSLLCLLKGDLQESYNYGKQTIDILSQYPKKIYNDDEIVTITAIIYNQLQLSVILDYKLEAQTLLKKWQYIFDLRIAGLKNKIEDDSLDWADPDEDINDILEFMEEENSEAIKELDFLSNPLNISNIYIAENNLIFFHKDLPKHYMCINLLDDMNISKVPFEIDNNKVVGIKGFPKWML
ncbi:MAG: restriction endonuclease [Oscillospiraceae bacterium]|nr:restriction endonuclease [Oscillospiraceae bacterium]